MKINKLNFKKGLALKTSKGFTLIELLVVVAIIGILASIITASLNSGKTKTIDAKIQSTLASVRNQANILYTSHGIYNVDASTTTTFPLGACAQTADTLFADSKVWALVNDAVSANGGTLANVSRCSQTVAGGDWAVAVTLETSDGATSGSTNTGVDSWCVDSGGRSKSYAWASGQTIANAITANACN